MKKKIIMIVDNSKTSGLRIVLQEVKACPFVNSYINNLNDKNPFLFIAEQEVFLTDQIDKYWDSEWDILLIKDESDDKIEIAKGIDKEYYNDALVMYHKKPQGMVRFLNNSNCYAKRPGQHEKGIAGKGYPLLVDIIEAWDEKKGAFKKTDYDQAIKAIIDWFEVDPYLDSALNLLHECLTPKGAKKALSSKVAEEFKIQEQVEILSATNDSFSKKYLETLAEIRDNLLIKYEQ